MLDSPQTLVPLARGVGPAVALAVGLALERWRPHTRLRPAWGTNLGIWAAGLLLTVAVCGACGFAVADWASARGIGVLAWSGASLPVAIVLSVLALDAVSWLWHAANHRFRLLWRFHEVHHADESFHVTTALRFHPGELLLSLPIRLAAIVLLGVPVAGVLVFELVFGIANVLEHGNFDWPRRLERPLRQLLVTPTLHRGHHVASWRELDSNFGTVFSIWDRLAGTYRAHDAEDKTGTGSPDWAGAGGPRLWQSLWLPFATRRRTR